MATRRLPFFVYGTLMRGFKNHNLILQDAKRGVDRFAWLSPAWSAPGHSLVHLDGFPGMYKQGGADADGRVCGELILFGDDDEQVRQERRVRRHLDALEGFTGTYGHADNDYDRVVMQVALPDTAQTRAALGTFSVLRQATVAQPAAGGIVGLPVGRTDTGAAAGHTAGHAAGVVEGQPGAGSVGAGAVLCEAWTYLCRLDRREYGGGVDVPSGDWRLFMDQHGLDDALEPLGSAGVQ